MGKLASIDRADFRKLWVAGCTCAAMGDHFRVSPAAITKARMRFGLNPRITSGPRADAPSVSDVLGHEEPKAKAQVVDFARPNGAAFWTVERDASLLASSGRYAQLAALATDWGVPYRNVLARWHMLRVAA